MTEEAEMKIAYVTDSGTGKSIETLAKDGIVSIPLQITDETHTYQDMETLLVKDNLKLLEEGHLLKTSQPSPGIVEECFASLKKQGVDLIIAVPICNGLSGTISTMTAAANELGIRIITADTYVTAVVQDYLIHYIKESYEKGISDLAIRCKVEEIINSTNTLVIPQKLDQLVRGGRLTPMAARLAKFLQISPVLQINKKTSGRIDTLEKVRTFRKALERGMEEMENDGVNDGSDLWSVTIAHVDNIKTAEELYHKMHLRFPKASIQIIDLCNAVAAHTGIGAICLQWFKKAA
jgi:DegV family protein with EDD domain